MSTAQTITINGKEREVYAKATVTNRFNRNWDAVLVADYACGGFMWVVPAHSFMSLGVYGAGIADVIDGLRHSYPQSTVERIGA